MAKIATTVPASAASFGNNWDWFLYETEEDAQKTMDEVLQGKNSVHGEAVVSSPEQFKEPHPWAPFWGIHVHYFNTVWITTDSETKTIPMRF